MTRASHRVRRRGFTLIELIASTVILGVLAATIAPIVVTSSTQLSDVTTQRRAADTARDTLDRVIRIIESAPATVSAATGSLNGKKVLFPVADAGGTPNAQEQRRIDLFASWGCTVTTIASADSQANLLSAAAAADVVYISEVILSSALNTKLTTSATGILTEESQLVDELQMATTSGSLGGQDTITITDATHPITSAFGVGGLLVMGAPHVMSRLDTNPATYAPGLQVLGDTGGAPSLAVLPAGATTTTGGSAAGPRVFLSLGATPMQFEDVSRNGFRLMARSMEWAIAGSAVEEPAHVSGVEIATAGATGLTLTDGATLTLTGSTLWYTAPGGAAAVLAQNVDIFNLTYVGADGVTDASGAPTATHRIDIRLVIDGFELRGVASPWAWRTSP